MDLKKLYDQARAKSEERSYKYGTLGRRNPDTTIEFSVPGRLDFLYVTLTDHTVVIARNEFGVAQVQDLQVKLKLDHGTWVIIGRSTRGDLSVPDETPPSGVLPHELGEHTDTLFDDPQAGHVLEYDGNNWVNVATIPTALAATIHAATTKATPVDADELGLVDSAASNVLKKLTWANLKATIKTYYDSVATTLTNKTLDSTNISTLTAKNPPIDADSAVIVDSAASNVFKRVTYTNIKAFLKTYFDTLYSTLLSAYSAKNPPVDADSFVITDSAAGDATKRVTGTNVKAYLKTYFDTLYGLLAAANTWTANNAFNSTATSGSALGVTRNLTATSTDAPVVTILQDHPSDDQQALKVTQDGTGAIAEFLDAATRILAILDGGEVRFNNAAATSAYLTFAIAEAVKAYIGVAGATNALMVGAAANDLVIRTAGGDVHVTTDGGLSIQMSLLGGAANPLLSLNAAAAGLAHQRYQTAGVTKAYIGVPGATNSLITGAAAGDFGIRVEGGRIIFSTNTGSTIEAMFSSGNFALGVAAPQGRLHVHDGTGGHMIRSVTGVVGSEVELIADGTGDVVKGCRITSVGSGSGGTMVGSSAGSILTPGAGSNTLVAGSLTFKLYSTGQLVVFRNAGVETWAVTVDIIWQ